MTNKQIAITLVIIFFFLFTGFWLFKALIMIFCLGMLNPGTSVIFLSSFLFIYYFALKAYEKWKLQR